MKSLTYITLIAAFVFGMNHPNVNAASNNDNVSIEASSGTAQAHYDEASQILSLRMVVPSGKDRVMIYLATQRGNVVFKEKAIVNSRGTIVKIPMADLPEGNYFLRVKGSQISYYMRIKHK